MINKLIRILDIKKFGILIKAFINDRVQFTLTNRCFEAFARSVSFQDQKHLRNLQMRIDVKSFV